MKRTIISALVAISANSAQANTYNYVCKDQGKSFPLKVDDAQNTLEWKGTTYKIKKRTVLLLISVRPRKVTPALNRMALKFRAT